MHVLIQGEDAHSTFSTRTLFSRTFSTMTVESFHDYNRHLRPFKLILFHAYARPHIQLSPCGQDLRRVTLHIFGFIRFLTMLLSPLPFDAR
jgi:hypothetical protein